MISTIQRDTTLSYPEARYHGDSGQHSATFRRADEAPDITYSSGGTARYLTTGATTEGGFGLYRWEMSATPGGPEPHFHRTISESFFVLSGAVRFFDGREWHDGGPGDFFHVPPGGIHAFRNDSGAPATMLILFSPGAPREDYFETLARVAGGETMSDEERAAFFLRHDSYWL